MTQYGGMGCGTKCGKWVSKVGKLWRMWLSLNMQIIEAVPFWKASLLIFFSINQGVAES